ncbi:MAG: SDR family oxidoreductase [Paracoccaceae bacterium]|nr:SDR family oxidoreductase [Paracoccaceae bacterium]
MPNTALITGASSGLGAEFARYHARRGGDLIITARRKEALEALKAEIEERDGVTVHVISCDLGAPGGAERLYDEVKALGERIEVLINNAGFGGHGLHTERPLEAELKMIELNVTALVTLTHKIGADMVAAGGGRILQVGSTAGFMPGPQQAVYFATKAFVGSYSQAIDHELRKKGVTVTVLAPGYVETEFAKTADLEGTGLVKGGGKSAASVAKIGYDGMRRGELVVFNEGRLKFLLGWVTPFLPRRAVLKMVDGMQTK